MFVSKSTKEVSKCLIFLGGILKRQKEYRICHISSCGIIASLQRVGTVTARKARSVPASYYFFV